MPWRLPMTFMLTLSACATLSRATPDKEFVISAVSTQKIKSLAEQNAHNRATQRAGFARQATPFVFDRTRAKPILKLLPEPTLASTMSKFEAHKPQGVRALITVTRSQEELASLAQAQIARVRARASGLDLAVAQDRADRALYREAITRFADAAGKREPILYGKLMVVNYDARDWQDGIEVRADILVSFSDRKTITATRTAEHQDIDELIEEAEPPEETAGEANRASQSHP